MSEPAGARHFARRAIVFALIFAALQLGWQSLRDTAAERVVIHDGVVVPAAMLVNLLTPAAHAEAAGFSLHASGGGLNILNGCEGTEALFLLLAAFCVAPISGPLRLVGFLLGSAVIFVVNQLRVLVLFYAYRADHALFDPLHAIVTPIAVVLLVCVYFYAWLSYSSRRLASAA
jgi:exosortase/archaeosortase family protein